MVVGTSSVSWRQWKINKKIREILGVVERERKRFWIKKIWESTVIRKREMTVWVGWPMSEKFVWKDRECGDNMNG